ncbi:kinase-like protein [Aureobasidium subglaciale]|nr:kinase-like protein [Aureobasidium subglaciale]KAI5218994.1 kinase-like protein [Aureobasidium subglaciale]KAI5222684.1 kinase-like protein [Aureobasidium subglaciale]KAI5260185.1 kinase-like protein [Aureobasidium subglaciale]
MDDMQDMSSPKHNGVICQCYDETFNSYYQHDKSLSGGGQGIVELAKVKATGKIVVVKKLKLPPNADLNTVPELVLLDRVQKLGSHDNILPFLQIWNTFASAPGECPTSRIILPYVSGGDLNTLKISFTKMNVKVPEAFLWHAYTSMLTGFGYLHEHGITHRDIKPENIMVDPVHSGDPALFPTLKIIDFGIAAETTEDHESMDGTPKWQPPEAPVAGTKADVWAIGAVIHFLATGFATKADRPPSMPQHEITDYYRNARPYIRRLVENDHLDFDVSALTLGEAQEMTFNSPNRLPRRGYSALIEYYMMRTLDLNHHTRITIPRLNSTLPDDADKQIQFYKAWFRHCKIEGSQRPILTFSMVEPPTAWAPPNTTGWTLAITNVTLFDLAFNIRLSVESLEA